MSGNKFCRVLLYGLLLESDSKMKSSQRSTPLGQCVKVSDEVGITLSCAGALRHPACVIVKCKVHSLKCFLLEDKPAAPFFFSFYMFCNASGPSCTCDAL
jgi:hypothetical protein